MTDSEVIDLISKGRNGEACERQAHDDAAATAQPPLRLHVGSGNVHLSGFTNVDRKQGKEAYPLDVSDDSVEEILASHVLEHFAHANVSTVLKHWTDKLKPGGKIRLAVPDFERVAKDYLAGLPINVQGYVMGGQIDGDDFHGTIFDRESLTELMIDCGLERIGTWKSDVPGCSQLPISLNLQGFKPASADPIEGISKCLRFVGSTPRFGPLMHPRCLEKAVQVLRLRNGKIGQSCYWHQRLCVGMEQAIADNSCEFVLTLDFDTIFRPDDVVELYRLLRACPDADAVFPLQSKRGTEQALFSASAGSGKVKSGVSMADLSRNLLPAFTGHFGLTMFRAETLRKLPRPWMVPEPNSEGRWDDGQIDADVDFWRRFERAGNRAFLAPKVVVGHLEEVVKWPGKDLVPVYQQTADYEENGIPPDVLR